jgi:DNA-binding transcriptional MerR regulator
VQIGELSRRTGISVRMLRYYEEEGVLRPARRESGYRDYGPAEEQLARRIRMLSEAGLKLDAIRTLLPCVLSDLPELDLCDEVQRHSNARSVAWTNASPRFERAEILTGYLGKDTKRHATRPSTHISRS